MLRIVGKVVILLLLLTSLGLHFLTIPNLAYIGAEVTKRSLLETASETDISRRVDPGAVGLSSNRLVAVCLGETRVSCATDVASQTDAVVAWVANDLTVKIGDAGYCLYTYYFATGREEMTPASSPRAQQLFGLVPFAYCSANSPKAREAEIRFTLSSHKVRPQQFLPSGVIFEHGGQHYTSCGPLESGPRGWCIFWEVEKEGITYLYTLDSEKDMLLTDTPVAPLPVAFDKDSEVDVVDLNLVKAILDRIVYTGKT